MRFGAFLSILLVLVSVSTSVAQQARTVTNVDLEKYRQQRLKAEKDYEENYARLGFPSPEELQKQIEKSRVEREELSSRLAAERIERERAEAARAYAESLSVQNVYVLPGGQSNGRFFYGYQNWYFPRGRFRPYVQYGPPITAGNGIPINTNIWYPPVRPAQRPLRFVRP